MCVFYYRAYDEYGEEKKGVLDAPDERSADRKLRRTGLRPFLICDYEVAKQAVAVTKARKRRRGKLLRILAVGSIVIPLTAGFAWWIERWAGREVAPDIAAYMERGLLVGAKNTIYGPTPETRAAAQEFASAWRSIAPGTLDGLEAQEHLVAIHVNDNIVGVERTDTESLMAAFVKAMRRRFGVTAPTVMMVYAESPLAEATYDESGGVVVITYF